MSAFKKTVAIVSDTHAFLDERIAALVKACDYAVHAGDIGSAEVLEALRPRSGHVVAVAGNNDIPEKWLEHELHIVTCLPIVAELELPGGCLIVEHGDRHGFNVPRHDSLRQKYSHARAIAYGHSHKLVCDQDANPWVLNPGAAGRVRTHGGPSFLILSASHAQWTVEIRRFSLQA